MKQKNYSQKFIDIVQNAVNAKNYKLDDLQSWDDMPRRIRINGVYINLMMSEDNIPSTSNQLDEELNSENFKKWTKTAIGRFFGKDWRMSIKKPSVYKLYKFLETTVTDSMPARMLIRKITEDDLKTTEELTILTDIMINDEPYVIIKAYSLNETDEEYFNFDSILEEKIVVPDTNIDQILNHIDISNDNDFENIPDNTEEIEETEELF